MADLTYRYQAGQVLVSFQVRDAFDREDIKEALQSTRPITITYWIQVTRTRAAWKNKAVARHSLKRTVRYDNLTHQYTVATVADGGEPEEKILDTWEEMVALVQGVTDFPAAHVALLEAGPDVYEVRAKVHFLSDSFLWIIPWDLETHWEEVQLKTP